MNGRSNKSRMFRAASLACSLCVLLAVSGCALLEGGARQKPLAPESIETAGEKAEPAPKEEAAEKPAAPKKSQPEAAEARPETDASETAAVAEPELEFDKDYALEQSDKIGLDSMATTTRTGITLEGEGPYPTSADLQMAAETAFVDGRVIGDIASFDAFPDIPGEDTVARVFREKDHPGRRIKLFAFHAPGQQYHRIIYGYVVEDTVAGESTGYFDENLDGVFEKITLKPYIKPAALFGQ